jgi:hypothetical protein
MIKTTFKSDLKEGQLLHIIPMGDIHYNTKECDKERFHRAIEWASNLIKKGDDICIIGVGDYNDSLSPSERASLVSSNRGFGLHDTTLETIDELAREQVDTIGKAFKPLTGHFAGLLDGHHYMVFSGVSPKAWRGRSNTEVLCEKLGTSKRQCAYLGKMGWVTIELGNELKLEVLAAHGYGGARTVGARMIKRVRMSEVARADIFLMGHDNLKAVYTSQILDFIGDNYISRKQYFIGTGSFQRAYMFGAEGGYVEELLLPPSDLGISVITVRKEKRNGRWRKDWHCSV